MNNQKDKHGQNLDDLMKQFAESRDSVFNYLKEKPRNDIVETANMVERFQRVKKDWKLDSKNDFNFAFVGHAKSGKSSLINALGGIDNEHPDAAPVGCTESTCQITTYTFSNPEMKHVKFWDFPGPGVDDFQKNRSFCGFDCVFICCPEGIDDNRMMEAIDFICKNQQFAFVKTKCDDNHLNNALKMKKIDHNYGDPCFHVSASSLNKLMNNKNVTLQICR